MEMEMDIPLPEELEWLETNALLHEEVDEEEYYAEEELPKASSPISDLPVSENQTCRKRPLEGPDGDSVKASVEKRNKTAEGTGTDEDWLRYSPTKNSESDPAGAENSESDPATDAALADDVAPVVVEEKVLCRFASEIEGDCFSVTGPCGDRVYAKMSPGETSRDVKRSNIERPLLGLLSEPINVLMERVEQEAFRKGLEASSVSVDDSIHPTVPIVSEQLWVDKYAPNSFTELLSDEQTNREVLLWLKQWDSCVFGSQIRTTTDDVLSALRRHSSLAQHQKVSESRSSFSKNRAAPFGNQTFKQSNGLNQGDAKSKNISELWNKKSVGNDQLEHKVLLLCGPPGLGKTTLAHVAAKHCGYRVVEINASDDRSSSTIESKILDVVQMNSVMADSKPKCLVIDEIDGALGSGKGAVEVILKMVAAEKRSVLGKGNGAQEVDPGKASSRKGPKAATLSRPVICICNDIYAPALRPLRQVAKVHTFVQPTISRVVNRLKYICNKEGFKTSSIALTALAEYTECDIRSCLNTLQFLNKKKEALNTLEVGSQVVGRKDMSKSVLDVWKEVFQKRRVKRERKSSNSCTSEPMDFGILYSLISNRGDCELTMDGIHENFLQLHYHDPMMHKTVKCLTALGVSDSMAQYAIRTQQMSLYVYQPSIAIAIRSLVAQVEKPNIEWPKSFQRYRAMLMEKKDLLKLWHTKIAPSISRHLTIESFVEDAISPLLHILSPPTLRPGSLPDELTCLISILGHLCSGLYLMYHLDVPSMCQVALHLLSEREKGDLAQLVDTMVSYSITYKNLKPEPQPITWRHEATSDASTLSFDPPIGDFVNFKGYHCGRSGLSLAMKQILVHEVEKRKILRESTGRPVHLNDENQVLLPEGSAKPFSSKTNSTTANFQNNTEDKNPVLTQNLWKANGSRNSTVGSNKSIPVGVKLKAPGDTRKPSGGSTSFFDRFRKSSSKSSQNADDALQKSATSERDSRPLLFKYNEGFTNAVKRPVRMRELLL